MKRVLLAVVVLMLAISVSACPDPVTGKVDPYLTADNAIAFAKSSLVLADTMFTQVVTYAGLKGDKLAKATATYKKVRTAVDKGLDAAKVALDIAKKNKDKVNVAALLADTDKAWRALTAFIGSLLPEGGTTSTASTGAAPALEKPDLAKLPKSIIKQ